MERAVRLQFLEDRVEDPVDEASAVGRAEDLADFDRFIDGDLRGNVREIEEFCYPEAQDHPVDHGDPVGFPVHDLSLDQAVDVPDVLEDGVHQGLGELEIVPAGLELGEYLLHDREDRFAGEFVGVEDLKDFFPGLPPS